jgi:phage terminase large subunit-like protein
MDTGPHRGRTRGKGAAAVAHRDRRRPPGSARPGADACGIVAAGIAENGTIYVLADTTVQQLAPHGWASAVVALFSRMKADLVVAEGNQGGDMVRAVLQQVDPAIPVRTVHATRGKWLRAEPVAMRYQQGKVKHVDPPLEALEDQMCDFGITGLSSAASPDRLDALVWAITDLMRGGTGPRVTVLKYQKKRADQDRCPMGNSLLQGIDATWRKNHTVVSAAFCR